MERLAKSFGVSKVAVNFRLVNLGLIPTLLTLATSSPYPGWTVCAPGPSDVPSGFERGRKRDRSAVTVSSSALGI